MPAAMSARFHAEGQSSGNGSGAVSNAVPKQGKSPMKVSPEAMTQVLPQLTAVFPVGLDLAAQAGKLHRF